MWRSIERLRDWGRTELWPRIGRGPRSPVFGFSFEQAGATFFDQPVPWNVESVQLVAALRLPPFARQRNEFILRLAGRDWPPAEPLRRSELDDRRRLLFRFPPPSATANGELLWRGRLVGHLTLPILDAETFLSRLQLHEPTLAVRLGRQHVVCRTFVASQCRELLASARLTSPTSLAPLAQAPIRVEFRCGARIVTAPISLGQSQLSGRQATVFASLPRSAMRRGDWIATWLAADRALATCGIRAISAMEFAASVRAADARFLIENAPGQIEARRVPGDATRFGPSFAVSSSEPDAAGLMRLRVETQPTGAGTRSLPARTLLVTNTPVRFSPGMVAADQAAGVTGYDLRWRDDLLGSLTMRSTAAARFTAEGGFAASGDVNWNSAAEEELNERLSRLMDE